MVAAGCNFSNASLQVESGPPVDSRGGGVATYSVHVGERVKFTFALHLGAADYAVFHDETTDTWDDCGPPIQGRFEWTHAFDLTSDDEAPHRIAVTAYSQNGRRDAMPFGGKLIEGNSPGDAADFKLARASTVARVYQSIADIPISPGAVGRPDWHRTRLVIHRDDGSATRVPQAAAQSPGFTVNGPDKQGAFTVRYRPGCDEVNRSGQTDAELLLADESGRVTSIRARFPTP